MVLPTRTRSIPAPAGPTARRCSPPWSKRFVPVVQCEPPLLEPREHDRGDDLAEAAFLCPSVSDTSRAFTVKDQPGNVLARFARSHYVLNAGNDEPWGYQVEEQRPVADGPFTGTLCSGSPT